VLRRPIDNRNKNTLKDEYIDDNINPWQQIPPSKRYYQEDQRQYVNKTPTMRQPSPMYNQSPPQQQNIRSLSASSSVTATPRNRMSADSSTLEQYTATVALGPATKRALESLQNEVIALNDRIDDLRRELVESDKRRAVKNERRAPNGDGWKWILNVKRALTNKQKADTLFNRWF
jgi:hypothetical protein